MAESTTEHPSLNPIVTVGLLSAVAMATLAINTTPAEKSTVISMVVLLSMAVSVSATRSRYTAHVTVELHKSVECYLTALFMEAAFLGRRAWRAGSQRS